MNDKQPNEEQQKDEWRIKREKKDETSRNNNYRSNNRNDRSRGGDWNQGNNYRKRDDNNNYRSRDRRKNKDEIKPNSEIQQETTNAAPTGEGDRDKKSAMLYSLWQSNQSKTQKQEIARSTNNNNKHHHHNNKSSQNSPRSQNVLDKQPTKKDLNQVVFSPSSTFEINEIVIAPRTRGGFSYAKVTKQIQKTHCFFDPMIEHKTIVWRVVYNNNGKSLFKDLPAPYIGKLNNGIHGNNALEEFESMYEASPDIDFTRIVGELPTLKDLQCVVFSNDISFVPDELVLVPRSHGGFTYGRILKETSQSCKLVLTNNNNNNKDNKDINNNNNNNIENNDNNKAHNLSAWRIIVNEDNPQNVTRKDLCSSLIGKITFTTSELKLPKNRMQLFKMCEEVPDLENAAKKESEIIEEEEQQLILQQKQLDNNYRLPVTNNDTSFDNDEIPDEIVLWNANNNNNNNINNNTKDSEQNEQQIQQQQPSLQVGGIIAIDKDDLFRKLMKGNKDNKVTKINNLMEEEKKQLIVLDGPNVAKKHGKDQEFSTDGIKIAINYWNERGHDCLAFVPEHYVRRKPGQTVTLKEFMPKASNLTLMNELIDKGNVILTPPQDYDDIYVINYAMKHNGCIVTNDRFWDHIEKSQEKGMKAKREMQKWIRDHTISFTFVRDEFLPNPTFKFPPNEVEKKEPS